MQVSGGLGAWKQKTKSNTKRRRVLQVGANFIILDNKRFQNNKQKITNIDKWQTFRLMTLNTLSIYSGSKVIGHTNVTLHGWKPFTIFDCLKPANITKCCGSPPWRCSARPSFGACLWVFLHLCTLLYWNDNSLLTWPLKNIQFLCLG